MKKINMCTIFMYKSSRKNAETSDIINILSVCSTDENVLYQLIGTLEKTLFFAKKYNHIEISSLVSINKKSSFVDANNNIHTENQIIKYRFERKVLYSCENLVNYIYSMYCMLYPENNLSYNTLYDNSSIKWHINKYYIEKESKGNEQYNL